MDAFYVSIADAAAGPLTRGPKLKTAARVVRPLARCYRQTGIAGAC
jgi:hypothetical protein